MFFTLPNDANCSQSYSLADLQDIFPTHETFDYKHRHVQALSCTFTSTYMNMYKQ